MPITHLGVSDAYLAELQVEVPESFQISCSSFELASMALLEEAFPDVRVALSPKCFAVLQQGRKIELESVVSTMSSAASVLLPATKRLTSARPDVEADTSYALIVPAVGSRFVAQAALPARSFSKTTWRQR